MFAVARIGAGVDLSQVSVRDVVLGEDGVVEMTVPAAEIQYVDPDEDATQVLERDTGIFASGDPGLESDDEPSLTGLTMIGRPSRCAIPASSTGPRPTPARC